MTTVLLVDDDVGVLNCLQAVLRHYGFTVLPAATGKKAAQLYQQHQDSITLVLLDVQIPVTDGPQTFALLKGVNPTVRVVFMSGHCPYSVRALLALGALCVLEKPFRNVAELAETLQRLADEPH
jgi:CheY-like chemotaxis protein